MSNKDQLDISDRLQQGHCLEPFQRKLLQKTLQNDLPPEYSLRIRIMLLADEGHCRSQICKSLGCAQGTARHWILMAQSGQGHKWQNSPIGRPKTVNEQYLERLRELVNQSPREFGYSFPFWTGQCLGKHLEKEFGVSVSDRHINRLLKQLGLSTRPKTDESATNQTGTGNSSVVIRDLVSSSSSKRMSLEVVNLTPLLQNDRSHAPKNLPQ